MDAVTSYFGTWEEIKRHEQEFTGHKMAVKIIKDPEIAEQLIRLEQSLEGLRKIGRDKGPYPNYKMDLDFFYPDDERRVRSDLSCLTPASSCAMPSPLTVTTSGFGVGSNA